jgi:hypothetical protein
MRVQVVMNLISLFFALPAFGQSDGPEIRIPLSFDHYYSYEKVVEALQALHEAYPDLTHLDEVGESEEGRTIYAFTINNPETGAELEKPGVYADANIHGNELQATEVVLYFLDYLLAKYGHNEEITKLVDKNAFYVIPIVNVDGRYHFFADANTSSSNRGLRRPKDDDKDGLVDEDFPDDLDGDGNICTMRMRDPFGRYKTDPEDPRLMIEVKPGEIGEWRMLGREGIDNDGDGRINEDSEGFVDTNRNWGYDWMPDYVQRGAGDFPFSGIGVKAIAAYIQKRPNITIAWALHNSGGMYLRGPSTKAQGEYPQQDLAVYDYLGAQAERITPGYRYMILWKDLYSTYGDFLEWMVGSNGVFGFVAELYQSSQETFKTHAETQDRGNEEERDDRRGNPDSARERLKFSDNLVQGELYKEWTPYQHPTYGEIEIGGWVKLSSRLPAPFMLKDLVHRNAMAIIYSAKNTPEVSLDVFGVEKIGDDLYRVRTRLHNAKAVPTMSMLSQKNKLYPKDMLTVSGANATVLAGGALNDAHRDSVTYKEHRPELQFLVVPGFGKVEHQFLISGQGSVEVNYCSRWAGKISKTVELN